MYFSVIELYRTQNLTSPILTLSLNARFALFILIFSGSKKTGGGRSFFRDFWRPPAAYFDPPPFINFSNFSRGYTEVHKYIRLLMSH